MRMVCGVEGVKKQTINMSGKPGAPSASIYPHVITGHVVGSCIIDRRKAEGYSVTHIASGYRVARAFKKLESAKAAVPVLEAVFLELGLDLESEDIASLRTGGDCVRVYCDSIRALGGKI